MTTQMDRLVRGVGGLARDINRKKSKRDLAQVAQFDGQRAAVSCPPDAYIHVRGGWLFTEYGEQLPTPTISINFGLDPDGTWGIDNWQGAPEFTTAGYYRGAIVLRENTWDSEAQEFGNDTNVIWTEEYSTAACVEQWADWDLRWTLDKYYGYPLCIIIVKNDGITATEAPGVHGHILPIDAVNRGRSYLWRDIRPIMYHPWMTVSVGAHPTEPTCT